MAVTFVIGNAHRISGSILAPGTTISATIANEFTEAVGDLYTSSLIALGLILFVITFIVLGLRAADADASQREAWNMTIGPSQTNTPLYRTRRRRNVMTMGMAYAATAFGLAWLVLILIVLLWKGFSGLSVAVFTEMTPPPGLGRRPAQPDHGQPGDDHHRRGDRHALGMLAGTYMAEYGRYDKLSTVVRFINDILLSAPSIVMACSSTRSWSPRWATSPAGPAPCRSP